MVVDSGGMGLQLLCHMLPNVSGQVLIRYKHQNPLKAAVYSTLASFWLQSATKDTILLALGTICFTC